MNEKLKRKKLTIDDMKDINFSFDENVEKKDLSFINVRGNARLMSEKLFLPSKIKKMKEKFFNSKLP